MRDFSLDIYRELLEKLQLKGYELIGFADYIHSVRSQVNVRQMSRQSAKYVILRHDVDAKPGNSLKIAQIEHAIGAKATYYVRQSTIQPEILRAIVKLGHEIGYHYEDLSLCGGDADKAYEHFKTWLDYLRQFYAVETICMHGAPTSKYDSKDLWKSYDYKSLGIIGEPYLDTDFKDVFYLTDTGRCWDGYKMSVRDKIPEHQARWTQQGLSWHTTKDLLKAIKENKLPAHVLMTTHPQRWTNDACAWWTELLGQTAKNLAKRALLRIKD